MSLVLHFHPLSSFCQKVLVGLYEFGVPFEKHLVDLSKEAERAALCALWPMGKFPVLRDEAKGRTVPESSIILEYLDRHYAGATRLCPSDPDRARECRLRDRFYDLYVNVPMQKIVTDKLRPEGQHDPFGVAEARAQLERAYGMADEQMRESTWAMGDEFSMADCAAAPALFYASKVLPFGGRWPHLAAYYERLSKRPSFARVLAEAQPYLAMFPG
ncbi:MAG: glutathione S-transferase family protein [Minicystis sp.]